MIDLGALTKEIYDRVYTAADAMQDEEEAHAVPSPSGIYGCIRQQWFQGKRIPRTNRIPVRSYKKMQAGKRIEPFWREVYERAEFEVVEYPERIPVWSGLSSGEPDGKLIDTLSDPLMQYGLELKDLGIWSYFNMLDKGLKEGLPEYWYQVQDYLEAQGLPLAIVHAGMADASAVVWFWQKIKKREGRPPDFLIEVVPFSPSDYYWSKQRAEEVKFLVENEDDPAKVRTDYEGKTLNPAKVIKSKKTFPCGYCGHLEACLKVGVMK